MAKLLFEMPDDLAAAVEAYRIKMGHKATALAVRELLRRGLGGDPALVGAGPAPKPASGDEIAMRRSKTVVIAQGRPRTSVTSRLKGEWKAP